MGLLVVNSDFERLWNEPYPTISFDNTSYSLAGEVGTELSTTFAIFDNYDADVTEQCEITFDNDYVSIEEGMFVCDDLEVGTYQTIATATYSYKSATVTATATINISVEEEKATSISFGAASYTISGNEHAALSAQFNVEDNLGNDITSLCAYSFSPNDKGVYADGGYFKVDSAIAGTYNITVTATYGELTNTATIAMSVVDYPDSISFDSNSYTMTGNVGDTITQAFTVTDDLNNNVTSQCTYAFSPNNTGLIVSGSSFDASSVAEGTYSVTVTATYTSGNGSTLTATATVSMEIQSASFANKYFTTEALANNMRISMSVPQQYSSMTSISYSLDDGETWTTENVGSGYSTKTLQTPSLNQGDKVLWKGKGKYYSTSEYSASASIFSSTNNFNVEGNIMSLLYDDNFVGQTTFPVSYGGFKTLFRNNRIVSAENLVLPATTVTSYQSMFEGCTSLTTAPELPATTLVINCYNSMFSGCTSLTTAPTLPATTLANQCYQNMFSGCTSLTTAPTLPATTLIDYCYGSMFSGCTSLTTAPTLPATTLASGCYNSMFSGCTSLTTAPTLPATTLANSCYGSMFSGCTSLTTAPTLPATTLVGYCYGSMFSGCTSLTTAPTLPATTLASGCYNSMFSGTNLLPDCTNIDFSNSTIVNNGVLKGLFRGTKITDSDLNRLLPKDANNKPCLPVTSLTADNVYSYMFEGCTLLETAPKLPATTLGRWCYEGMFANCTSLVNAPELPATTLSYFCYGASISSANAYGMFEGCTSLTTAPTLPATTVDNTNYSRMFRGCTNLNSITMLGETQNIKFDNWVEGVASTGTFTKAAAQTTLESGNNGIPANWTVVDA